MLNSGVITPRKIWTSGSGSASCRCNAILGAAADYYSIVRCGNLPMQIRQFERIRTIT